MEFVNLSNYMQVKDPKILPFSELRLMKPLWLTQELNIVDEPDNLEYARSLAAQGIEVVSIKRKPLFATYLNRATFPRRVIFEMTNRCNFLCRMCPQHNLTLPRIDMKGNLYRKVIDEIDKHGVEGLWMYNLGESLLHPEFSENVEHISTKKNLGIIWLSTNGEFFTEDKIKLLINSNLNFINFSAHAITEETYNTIVPSGKFKIVQANLEKYYELKGTAKLPRKPFLHCQMIEQTTTKHEVDGFIQKHYKRAEIVSVNMLEYVNLPNNKFGFEQRNRKPLTKCVRAARSDCIISSNGDVTLCDAAYNGELSLGNLNEATLYDIWNGSRRKEILNLNEQGRMNEIEHCSKCTDYDI